MRKRRVSVERSPKGPIELGKLAPAEREQVLGLPAPDGPVFEADQGLDACVGRPCLPTSGLAVPSSDGISW
jgi:hypothetical protein